MSWFREKSWDWVVEKQMFQPRLWIPIALALMLSGCAGIGIAATKLGIQRSAEFNEIVLADVREAILLAKSANDELALKCWTYVEEFAVTNAPSIESSAGEVIGVFSAYQLARNVRRTVVEVEISDQFRLECGPMLTDSMGALGRIGIRLAL